MSNCAPFNEYPGVSPSACNFDCCVDSGLIGGLFPLCAVRDDPTVVKTAFDKLTRNLSQRKSIPLAYRIQ